MNKIFKLFANALYHNFGSRFDFSTIFAFHLFGVGRFAILFPSVRSVVCRRYIPFAGVYCFVCWSSTFAGSKESLKRKRKMKMGTAVVVGKFSLIFQHIVCEWCEAEDAVYIDTKRERKGK